MASDAWHPVAQQSQPEALGPRLGLYELIGVSAVHGVGLDRLKRTTDWFELFELV